LQKEFAAVGETDPITIRERFQALLNKRHFFDYTHTQAALQILGNVVQSQSRAWWHTNRWQAGRE